MQKTAENFLSSLHKIEDFVFRVKYYNDWDKQHNVPQYVDLLNLDDANELRGKYLKDSILEPVKRITYGTMAPALERKAMWYSPNELLPPVEELVLVKILINSGDNASYATVIGMFEDEYRDIDDSKFCWANTNKVSDNKGVIDKGWYEYAKFSGTENINLLDSSKVVGWLPLPR